MKSIILTHAPINETEFEILKNTKIFKLAINQHAEELCPDKRIITDYVLKDILKNFSQKIISVREKMRYPVKRVEYFDTEFKGSTILAGVEYLISNNYDEILIVGDNSVNTTEFQEQINKDLGLINKGIKIFQYRNGNFRLQVCPITEFCK